MCLYFQACRIESHHVKLIKSWRNFVFLESSVGNKNIAPISGTHSHRACDCHGSGSMDIKTSHDISRPAPPMRNTILPSLICSIYVYAKNKPRRHASGSLTASDSSLSWVTNRSTQHSERVVYISMAPQVSEVASPQVDRQWVVLCRDLGSREVSTPPPRDKAEPTSKINE